MITFEIIPKDLNEQIEFYEKKIDEIKKINVMLIDQGYILPSDQIRQMLYFSKTIRHLKKRIEDLK